MRKVFLSAADAIMVVSIIGYFYFRAFERSSPALQHHADLKNIFFWLTLAGMVMLPFRIQRHPSLMRFILFNGSGEKIKTIYTPLACLIFLIFAILIFLRIVAIGFESIGVTK
ncbi:hypothetical protein [Burkholderia ubonensis]|uniref:hypothetical protein n=1 Tax=Burkholderia ubonensis TaxID=101571 RepID=UPI00116083FC|nr:hypothetical protein [Burkholderia ubonensis]